MKVLLPLLLAINLFAETYVISQNTYTQPNKPYSTDYTNTVTTLCIDGLVFVSVDRMASASSIVLTQVFINDYPSMHPKPCKDKQ